VEEGTLYAAGFHHCDCRYLGATSAPRHQQLQISIHEIHSHYIFQTVQADFSQKARRTTVYEMLTMIHGLQIQIAYNINEIVINFHNEFCQYDHIKATAK